MEISKLSKLPEQIKTKEFSREFYSLTYIFWGAGLLFLTSQISIPLQPVPITLQTVGVMLIGLMFERSHAIKAVLTYLGMGAVGVPVFANYHGGLPFLMGSSGGYLWGFLAAVICMTSLAPYLNYRKASHIALNCIAGTLVIFVFGIGWLSHIIGLKPAIEAGFYPFILPGIVKILLLTATVRFLKLGQSDLK